MNENGNEPFGVSLIDIPEVLGKKGYQQFYGEVL
jgi:hypothetical protein